MNITELISSFPEYAKDIKLNYSKILNEEILDKSQLYGIILISSLATHLSELKEAALNEVEDHLDKNFISDVYGAYSIMSMNAIYYRFTHLTSDSEYFSMPANLRMQYLNKHSTNKTNFELLCLSVAIIIGCGKCINAHEIVLRENNVSKLTIQTVARVTSIINAIANTMRVIK